MNKKKMQRISQFKKIFSDFIYSMAGLVCMNGVIQLVLYPYLNRQLGADYFGDVLTLLSVVSIMASTFGTAANYSRMMTSRKGQDANGDYNLFLLIIIAISLPVAFISFGWLGGHEASGFIGFFLLMGISILRYYADVEFRLNLNYKRFLIYYLLISAGYVAGVLVYPAVKSWITAILLGELLAVAYVALKGEIFSRPLFLRSPFFKQNMKSMLLLSSAYLVGVLILNADRLILQGFAGSTAVTVFYVATLIGKVVALVSTPLNSVIMGYLVRYDGKISSSLFLKICGGGIGIGILMDGACVLVSHVFVRILYPDIYSLAAPYFIVANAGTVFYFIANILVVILLRFTDEKYQLYINMIYLVIFLAVAIPMTAIWKLWGIAWSLTVVNLAKIFLIMIFGKVRLDKIRTYL